MMLGAGFNVYKWTETGAAASNVTAQGVGALLELLKTSSKFTGL